MFLIVWCHLLWCHVYHLCDKYQWKLLPFHIPKTSSLHYEQNKNKHEDQQKYGSEDRSKYSKNNILSWSAKKPERHL